MSTDREQTTVNRPDGPDCDAPTGRHARCETTTDIGAIVRNGGGQCTKVAGHPDSHRNSIGLTWLPPR